MRDQDDRERMDEEMEHEEMKEGERMTNPCELADICPYCGSSDIGDGLEDGTLMCANCLEEWGESDERIETVPVLR